MKSEFQAMNRYLVRYFNCGYWIPFYIVDTSIFSALDWVKTNVQSISVCIELRREAE